MTMTDTKNNTSTIEKSIEVDVPLTTAYNQWTQFESFPQFMGGVKEVTQLDDSHTHWKTSIAGVEREFDALITEQSPDERIAWKSTDELNQAGVVTFMPISDHSTKVTLRMEWEPEGLREKLGAAMNIDDKQVESDLNKFKELMESQQMEDGAWRGEIHDGQVQKPDMNSSGLSSTSSGMSMGGMPTSSLTPPETLTPPTTTSSSP